MSVEPGPHHLPAATGPAAGPVKVAVTPATAGWDYLSFAVVELAAGQSHSSLLLDQETAIVPIDGAGVVDADGESFSLQRSSVFTQMPSVLYAPPGVPLRVTAGAGGGSAAPGAAGTHFRFAIGSAPAEGLYPLRLFEPSEMKRELRGGGTAYRQVNHVLAMPLPAERLICYEVYVPRGTWAGWAPHCHDGREGSPYLEEVYWFQMQPAEGFTFHRNWRDDEGFDELFVVRQDDTVLVTKGYHSTVTCPTSHLYFLNYLAGELVGDDRRTPPCFHADYTWIVDDWDKGAWELPIIGP